MAEKKLVTQSRARRTARIQMDDGKFWSAPVGTPLETYFKAAYPQWVPMVRGDGPIDRTVVAAVVNGSLRELTYRMHWDAEVKPLFLQDSDGLRIYRRSLSLLLVVAANELFPGRKIMISHSLTFGGYYCYVERGKPLTPDELAQIKARMQEIVAADERIVREPVVLDDARAYFEANGDDDKLRLLKSRKRNYVILYTLRGYRDYFYGYMVPSTGYLTVFDLWSDGEGFILHYPRSKDPTVLQEPAALPKLRAVFEESGRWLQLLRVEDVGALNVINREGHMAELILVAEALHESRYADIADAILERQPDARLVLLAGPSSSGKTTSSKRLAIQLKTHGLRPFTLGMDDYFVSRDATPRDAYGNYDFEHIDAVDVDLFNQHALQLLDGKEVQLPRFNFLSGEREKGERVRLERDQVLIVEGIHALNPDLVPRIPRERIFRLYVSCLTQLNIDRHNRVPTTDVRLLRRIVRDAASRGYSAVDTIGRWDSVRNGERRWIFPYQENADVMFNSALVYELAVLRPLAEPLLLQVTSDQPQHIESKRLLSFLSWVEPYEDRTLVPANSVLREFIGQSILKDYVPGHASPR